MKSIRPIAAAAAALLTLGGLTACSQDSGDKPNQRADTNARAYYDDYPADTHDSSKTMSGAIPDASASSASGSGSSGELTLPPVTPAPDEDNVFHDAGVSGFVDTARDAESTFALDVDTGSFGVARSLLRSGNPVPAASIRAEEWINALPSTDPAPTGTDLSLRAETGLAPSLTDGTQLVRVGVAARVVDPENRPPVNVTLVVDSSGSMDIRERLGLVKASVALLAERLHPDDTVGLVTFESSARTLLPPTPVGESGTILAALDDLTPSGGTNLAAGLRTGYAQARATFDAEAVNLVVLASDGVANIGATGPDSITETIAEEGAEGIHLVTVGFGMGNYNDHLMEQLADLGDGFYSYVDTFAEAEQLFGTDLTTTLVPVASQARAQVSFHPDVVRSYRLIGYENRDLADEDFEDLTVDAGELGSGHHATALYEVVPAPGVAPGTRIGSASLRWVSPHGTPASTQTDLVAHDPSGVPGHDLVLAAAAADLAQTLKADARFVGRGVTLEDLSVRVSALERAEVPGAAELAEMVEQAQSAGPVPAPEPVE